MVLFSPVEYILLILERLLGLVLFVLLLHGLLLMLVEYIVCLLLCLWRLLLLKVILHVKLVVELLILAFSTHKGRVGVMLLHLGGVLTVLEFQMIS